MAETAYNEHLLRFNNSRRDIEVTGRYDDGRVYWYGDEPGVTRADFTEETVVFIRQTDEGTDIALPNEPEYVRTIPKSYMLGDLACSRYVWSADDGDWHWRSHTAPRLKTLNTLNQTLFQTYGAHNVPLTAVQTDHEDGLFKDEAMVECISDGVLPVSTAPGAYMHDTTDHGPGLIAIEADTMQILQGLCGLATQLKKTDGEEAGNLSEAIVHAYDVATFNYDDIGCMQLEPTRHDDLFTRIIAGAQRKQLPSQTMYQLVRTIERGPFNYAIKKQRVLRDNRVVDYYASIWHLVNDAQAD